MNGDGNDVKDGGDGLGRRVTNGWQKCWHDGRSINVVGKVEKGSE